MATDAANEFFIKAAWQSMWDSTNDYYLPNIIKNGINKDGIKIDALGNLKLGNVPSSGSIQLMKSDGLDKWLPVKSGYVGVKFSDVLISEIENVTNGGLTYKGISSETGTIKAKINLPAISISGNYTLVAKGLAECALDSAALIPATDSNSDLRTDNYLEAARGQRTKLWQTKHGGKLMDQYYEHNEVYNFTFQKNLGLIYSWQKPCNQYFMGTTYDSVQNPGGEPVNTGTYVPDDNKETTTSYNENAFLQKLALSSAAFGFSLHPPAGTNITKQQFQDAASAAQNFEGNVATTGNKNVGGKVEIIPMNINEVYDHINSYDPAQELRTTETMPSDYESFRASLTDDEIAYLNHIDKEGAALNVLESTGKDASATLLTGTFTVSISSGDLILDSGVTFTLESKELTATTVVTSFTSDLSISSIDITNQQTSWSGLESIGAKLIQAFNNSGQIASLMEDKVNKELESDTIKNFISTWLNDTLKKVLGNTKSY